MATKNTVEIYFRRTAQHDSWYADWTHDSVGSVTTVRFTETLPAQASEKQLIFLADKAFRGTHYAAEYRQASKQFTVQR